MSSSKQLSAGKRKRVETPTARDADGESQQEDVAEGPGSFATFEKAFESVMKREIAPEKGAVLAKRKTVIQKQLDRERIEAKAAAEQRKLRKAARVAQLVVPAPDAQGYERQLKKVATKGGG